jgi:hypothetical protein
MSKATYFAQIIDVLKSLKVKYPNQGVGQHLSMALAEYPNYWGMSDKEFLFAIQKYKFELDENVIPPEQEIEQLVKESSSIEDLREGIDYEDIIDQREDEDADEEE